ncbi:MAG TPA: 16S rRNA (cytidine(1402)-2'-O)-methyltransferase [Stellaceae bacterium]|nr:16S rRNA (cytidine(1402)-2'-O)-methyltransferase [Stellaceae bacterium]
MRRASSDSNAARATSGQGGIGGTGEAHPNGGLGASKPDLAPGLYLVATPIGNLADITLRALEVLRAADRICAEDTRVTHRLLARYGIKKPLEPYHDHNATAARPKILAALRRGERVALVSDAGTPLVSDPGYKLVRAAIADGICVSAAPGPSAALAALVLSGLPPDAFFFGGFLPPRSAARRRALEGCKGLAATLVFFEGPSRLAASLADMAETLGDRPAAIARELTKLHEEVRRGRLGELAAHYRQRGPPRGETVIVVGPPEPEAALLGDIDARLEAALQGHGVREAAARVAAELGLPRRLVYRRALELERARG